MSARPAMPGQGGAETSAPGGVPEPGSGPCELPPPSYVLSAPPAQPVDAPVNMALSPRAHFFAGTATPAGHVEAPPWLTRPPGGGRRRAGILAVASAVVVAAALTALVLWTGGARRDPAAGKGAGAAGAAAPRPGSPGASPGASSGGGKGSASPGRNGPRAGLPARPGAPPGADRTAPARAALQAFIRGIGNGDPSVCERYVTDYFADHAFGSMEKCRQEAQNVTERYPPENVQAMRTIVVTKGTVHDGHVVVEFADLRWTSGHIAAATLEERFVLAVVDHAWRLIR